jgi:hypothetical protein
MKNSSVRLFFFCGVRRGCVEKQQRCVIVNWYLHALQSRCVAGRLFGVQRKNMGRVYPHPNCGRFFKMIQNCRNDTKRVIPVNWSEPFFSLLVSRCTRARLRLYSAIVIGFAY